MAVYVHPNLCTGCGACLDVCARGAIGLRDSVPIIDSELCTECGRCTEACPAGAILSLEATGPESARVSRQPAVCRTLESASPARPTLTPASPGPSNISAYSSGAAGASATKGQLLQKALNGLLALAGWALDRRLESTGARSKGGPFRPGFGRRGLERRRRQGRRHRRQGMGGRSR